MVINIAVVDKRPTVDGTPVIVCGNSGYTINFTFDEEWAGHENKVARFVYVNNGVKAHQDVPFTGTTVAVPVLTNIREVQVGVYAGELQTTTPARISCERSILCNSGKDDTDFVQPSINYAVITGIAVTEAADGTVTITNTLYTGKNEQVVITPDAAGNPASMTYNGVEIPIAWTEGTA